MSNIAEFFSSKAQQGVVTDSPMPKKRSRKAAIRVVKPMQSLPSSAPILSEANYTLESNLVTPKTKRRGGHAEFETHVPPASPSNIIPIAAHSILEAHATDGGIVSDDVCPLKTETHFGSADIVADIMLQWRTRQRWHKAEKSLVLQGKALCRSILRTTKEEGSELFENAVAGKDVPSHILAALVPYMSSIEHFEKARTGIEKLLAQKAKKLPAYDWIESIHGIAAGGYASLIGECGDISAYKSVSALWKRMGLAVFDGTRQKKMTNAEDALLHGYNPSRRSVMWNIGNGLIGGMGRGKRPAPGADLDQYDWTPYQKLFVERCRYECANNPEKMALATVEKDGELRESYPKHAQARAKRYVEKRFLRDLYAKWNTA